MARFIGKFVILFVILGFVAACAPEEESNSPSLRRFGSDNYDIGVCENDPFSGDDFADKEFSNPVVKSEYFQKTFLPNQLMEALSASSYSVAKDLHGEGVDIFQVKTNAEMECRYFDFLQEPNGPSQKKWNESTNGPSNQDLLLGLFTTTYRKNLNTGKTELSTPTIMLLDKTQKWTLLHEMSHYLFAKARTSIKNLQFNSELEKKAKDLRNKIDKEKISLKKGGNKQQALELVTFYMDFFNVNHELDARTALEEFTIESMLLEYASKDEITGIENTEDPSNAYRYMLSNSLQVLSSYRRFLFELDDTTDNIFKDQWPVANEAMDVLEKRVETIIEFIEVKIEEAKAFRAHQIETQPAEELSLFQLDAGHTHHFDWKRFENRHKDLFNWKN